MIGINGEFPGPTISARSNDVIVVNVFNRLDEPLLFTWFVDALLFLLHALVFHHDSTCWMDYRSISEYNWIVFDRSKGGIAAPPQLMARWGAGDEL